MAEKEYIERGAYKEILERYLHSAHVQQGYQISMGMRMAIESCIELLIHAPAADVAPVVHSSWDYGEGEIEFDEHRNCQAYCRRCGAGDVHAERNINNVPFCWRCGAKMDGGKA